jgi:hypothetical protein
MAYGLHIENENGKTQIDSDFISYQVIATGTGTSVTWPSTWPTDTLVFVKPHSPGTSSDYFVVTNSFSSAAGTDYYGNATAAYRKTTMSCGTTSSFLINQACDYVAVVQAKNFTTPTSGYGINVFNSSQELAFTSELPTFRIRASRSILIENGGWNTQWYQGTIYGEMENLYMLADGYGRYESGVYGQSGEYFDYNKNRWGLYSYINNSFGTGIKTYTSDSNNNSSYVYNYNGYKTEMVGFAI